MCMIRSATPADAAKLLEIYAYYVTDTAISFEYDVPPTEEFRKRIETRLSRGYPYLVAEADGKLLGYAYAGPFIDRAAYAHCCELTIYLDKNARGRGIGRRLYGALEEALGEKGFRNLYACIGVPETEDEYLNFNSRDFHAHMGFCTVGTFRNSGYKFGRFYHMIWMEKLLGGQK